MLPISEWLGVEELTLCQIAPQKSQPLPNRPQEFDPWQKGPTWKYL